MNDLKLVRKTPFQKEGPNGVGGPYRVRFQLGPEGDLFISGKNTKGIFNTNGEMAESLQVVPEGIDPKLANSLHGPMSISKTNWVLQSLILRFRPLKKR